MKEKIVLLIASLLLSSGLSANSCYDIFKLDSKPEQSIDTAVFILIDETTLFDDKLKQQIISNALSKISANNYVYVAKFSAFVSGNYNEKVFDFLLDSPLSEKQRYNERKDTLNKIDKCIKDQSGYVQNSVKSSIMNSFLKAGGDIPKSDILYALQDFGVNVIAQVQAKEKIVILASDMLENSTITSFYGKGTSCLINADAEMKKVEANQLLTNFGAAKVYVIGTGIVSSDKSSTYRDPKILSALKNFWSTYIGKSNGKLIEMGQPALKSNIK